MIRLTMLPLLLWLATPAAAAQSDKSAPVDITADALPLKQDEEGTLKVRVAALTALDRVELSVSARTGVVLVNDLAPVTLSNVKGGDRREIEVPVRLTAAEFGYVLVSATVTTSLGTQLYNRSLVVGTMPPPPARLPVGENEDLSSLTLVKLATGNAIVRFDDKELLILRVGDRVGRNKGEIVEIGAGRIVIEETFVGADGRPNRARITIKEGEKGGTRVLLRNEEQAPPAQRQRIVVPPRTPRL